MHIRQAVGRGTVLLPLAMLLLVAGWPGCGGTNFNRRTGSLRVRIKNVDPGAVRVAVSLMLSSGYRQGDSAAGWPESLVELDSLTPGSWDARVDSLDERGEPLQTKTVPGVMIRAEQTTEIVVDLGAPMPECDPDSQEEPGLCTACSEDGVLVVADDDPRCGVINCSAFGWYQLRGQNTADGESLCIRGETDDITGGRCLAAGQCIQAGPEVCPVEEVQVAQAGLCHTIQGCEEGGARVLVSPDGTPCGEELVCLGGSCVDVEEEDPPESEAGCSDDTREGFLSPDDYPAIAGCAGAWSVPGVTRPDLAPQCDHLAGNHSDNPEGTGCSAADLCAAGWHVCLGAEEVDRLSPDGCAGAVPPGAPDKSLFFAVVQHSQFDSVCDQSDQANDIFGCGNLGSALGPDKNCGPLNRILASMQAGTCGFNEAEPPLGPWECSGDPDSDLHEGALVRKSGCQANSCSFDGNPVGNSDKGGVLCCRDD